MKSSFTPCHLIAIVVVPVCLAACRGQSSGRATVDTALVFVSTAGTDTCFKYDPEVVTIAGRLTVDTFPGRPNYESINAGDEPEPEYVLHLEHKICVGGDTRTSGNAGQVGIDSIQVVTADTSIDRALRPLVGREISVSGTLFAAETGHHHTRVLITAKSVRAA